MLNASTFPHCTCVAREDHLTDACEWCIAFSEYSDCYKDAYGIRPRGAHMHEWTIADFDRARDSLPKYDPEQEAREREAARLRVMPLAGAGWMVHFAGEPEIARDRYMREVDVDPEWLY